MVAGGDKHRGTIDKSDAASPTAALESILLTATIDAKEVRDVATVDIPNAFITTCIENEEDKVITRLRGRLAELMAATAPEIYKQYVTIDLKGNKALYVRTLNAIYGIMKAALLFYLKFVEILTSIGFVLNPYDYYVANKIIDRHQLTVVWHVDDLKISHQNENVVTRMIIWLRKTYEVLFYDGTGAMTVHRGKIHEYL